jgi:hypothetical protein
LRGRGDGSDAVVPSRRATQSPATGHASQRGRVRVQAEIHQALRVTRDRGRRTAGLGRQKLVRDAPQSAGDGRGSRPPFDAAMPCEHTLHVAVENRAALAVRERGDGGRRRAADAGQRFERRRVVGKVRTVLIDDDARGRVQVMRTTVIAETAPQLQHACKRRGGERRHRRKFIDEAPVVGQHGGNLRLLQHDFRQPDAVGVARSLPRQVAPAVLALPRDDARGEGAGAPPRRSVAQRGRPMAMSSTVMQGGRLGEAMIGNALRVPIEKL